MTNITQSILFLKTKEQQISKKLITFLINHNLYCNDLKRTVLNVLAIANILITVKIL